MSDPSRPVPPERPRYGEYAPGYTPPAAAPVASEPVPPAPDQPAWAAPPQPVQAPYGAQSWTPTPTARPRRTWDVVLTIVLLALGLIGTGLALLYAGILRDPTLLDEAFRSQGRGDFTGTVGSAPTIIAVSHVVLFLLAIGLSILFLVKRRIAFWIPLVIGVIASVLFWGVLVSVIMTDPGIMQQYGG